MNPTFKLLLSAVAGSLSMLTLSAQTLQLEDIYIRDPFIYANPLDTTYYMYRTTKVLPTDGEAGRGGVEVFRSKDLKNWSGPERVLSLPADNWSTGVIWAPEMHAYNGKYYLFATVNSDVKWKGDLPDWPAYTHRATQVFHADSPMGPFKPFAAKEPHTPMGQMCLDGTLYVEEGVPYMVYCHEWVELADGTMELLRLSPDLSGTEGLPTRLFCSSAAPWSTGKRFGEANPKGYITDGCFLYRSPKSGKLLMIWSSFKNDNYAIGVAESVTGKVRGPWRQQEETIFDCDGGHGMLFESFDGRLYIIFHGPNEPDGAERARLFEIEDTGSTLRLKNK